MIATLLAMQEDVVEKTPFTDTAWTDQYRVPFGDWFKQIVFWVNENTETALSIFEWPFKTMLSVFVLGDATIKTIPWVWVVALMFLIASMVRNVRVGTMVAFSLTLCAILGPAYWSETAHTIGLVFVAVLFCAIIAIPLGVLCGRMDGVWNVVRPTLDAMQVVHSFVYMLPVVFFWGVGNTSAVMVMMVFALPPLVRLTNLGVRQVPEDVVEASRSYGASELRVLFDVQLPLARPAIMTGLNQTLLLSISMLGIAALMGAGGLGRLIFQAIGQSDASKAASAGLAFFLVAVVLDRISQREDDDGLSMLDRHRRAWAHRRNPEEMLKAVDDNVAENAAKAKPAKGRPSPVSAGERTGLMVAAFGGVLAAVGTLLPWGGGSGLISSWSRAADMDLSGQTFSGLEASGGSWFGILVILFGLVGVMWAIRPLIKFGDAAALMVAKAQSVALMVFGVLTALVWIAYMLGQDLTGGPIDNWALWVFVIVAVLVPIEAYTRGTPRAGADGAAILGIGALVAGLAYMLASPNPASQPYSHQVGLYVSLVGAALLAGGALMAVFSAPYAAKVPIPPKISFGRILAGVMVLAFVIIGASSAWTLDERVATSMPPEVQAEIDALKAEAEADPTNTELIASVTAQINAKTAAAKEQKRVFINGVQDEGVGLGRIAIGWAIAGSVALLAASGLVGHDERRRWQMSTVTSGIGAGIISIAIGWIMSLVRATDFNFVSGAGILLTLIGGFVLFTTGQSVVNLYERKKVFETEAQERVPVTA